MVSRIFGHAFSKVADLHEEVIYGAFSIEELPHINAGRAQAKTVARIGVKENSPVVKLFPEYDERVGYRSFTARRHETPSCNLRTQGPRPRPAWRSDGLRNLSLTRHPPYFVPYGLSVHAGASLSISSLIAPSDRSIAFL
jgi:hypothetical protein